MNLIDVDCYSAHNLISAPDISQPVTYS